LYYARSLLRRLGYSARFAGVVGVGTAVGSYLYGTREIRFQKVDRQSSRSATGLTYWSNDLVYAPGAAFESYQNLGPRDAPVLIANDYRAVAADGHAYLYTGKAFDLSPAAQKSIRDLKGGAAIVLVTMFAAGDSYLVRPPGTEAQYPSDYAYTAAMIKEGKIPDNALVQLASSRVRMSDLQVIDKNDGSLAVSVRATTTELHLFDGVARWTMTLTKEGKVYTQFCGSGKALLAGIDVANNAMAGPLWDALTEKAVAAFEAHGKDPDFFSKAATIADLRGVVAQEVPAHTNVAEQFLRIMDFVSVPYVWGKNAVASLFAADPQKNSPAAQAAIRELAQSPAVKTADVFSPDDMSAIQAEAKQLRADNASPKPFEPSAAPAGDPTSPQDPQDPQGPRDPVDPSDPKDPVEPPERPETPREG
jgi:hypothetical protein